MIRTFTKIATIATVAALTSACAGTANTGSGAQEVAANTESGLVCKTIQKTGTRIGTRVCQTPEQAKQSAQDSQDAVNAIQRNSVQGAGPSGG